MNTEQQEVVDQLDNAETLIENLFYQANDTISGSQKVIIGKIGMAEITLLRKTLALDANKYQYTIDKSEINHAFNGHGPDSKEVTQGQQPITLSDLKNIPNILHSPDTLVYSGKCRKGLHALVYNKTDNNYTTVLVMELRTGKKELAFLTMYKK
jgi:hypothetical protein